MTVAVAVLPLVAVLLSDRQSTRSRTQQAKYEVRFQSSAVPVHVSSFPSVLSSAHARRLRCSTHRKILDWNDISFFSGEGLAVAVLGLRVQGADRTTALRFKICGCCFANTRWTRSIVAFVVLALEIVVAGMLEAHSLLLGLRDGVERPV